MKLKIISDGSVSGTKILNAKTNEHLEDVVGFKIIGAINSDIVKLELEFINLEINITGECEGLAHHLEKIMMETYYAVQKKAPTENEGA